MAIFSELINAYMLIFAYRQLFEQKEEDQLALKWLTINIMLVFYKIIVLILIMNLMFNKKRIFLYLIDAVAFAILVLGLLYGIYGFNP